MHTDFCEEQKPHYLNYKEYLSSKFRFIRLKPTGVGGFLDFYVAS